MFVSNAVKSGRHFRWYTKAGRLCWVLAMKKTCSQCHFLAKEHRDETGRVYSFPLSKEERIKAGKIPEQAVSCHYAMNCHMGV
jgi:hypothetical protein